MANAHRKRSGTPEDVGAAGVNPSVPVRRDQAEESGTAQEREVPVTAGSEMRRETTSTASSTGATPAMAPPAAEAMPARAAQQPMAERIEATLGRWGEQLGSRMASARRITRDRARALSASRGVHGEQASAHPPGTSAQRASPAERWPDSPTLQRAENVVNHMGDRVRPLASVIGQRVQRLFARAREEAEDIWAEAESMRAHGGRHTDQGSRPPMD